MPVITDKKRINEIFDRGIIIIKEVIPSKEELLKRFYSGDRLKIYIGADPTSNSLHLSHAKNYMLLEEFRQLGHEVIILVGDFTARIGDPTGRDSARPELTGEQVRENVKEWISQIKPLMDFSDKKNPPKIVYNSEWLSKLSFNDLLKLASNFTVQQMLARDMFWRRFKGAWRCLKCKKLNAYDTDDPDSPEHKLRCPGCGWVVQDVINPQFLKGEDRAPIYLHEFLYPLMQGYDSVALGVDIELCGTDQIFNALAGRTLLKRLKNKDKFVVVVNLMENPKTGEMMSKSKGTGVFLSSPPNEMYGAIMAQSDEMIDILFVNCTRVPLPEIKNILSLGPRVAKARAALEIVKKFYGEKKAKAAEEEFEKTFKKGGLPEHLPEIVVGKEGGLVEKLVDMKIIKSKTDWRRLIDGGAVRQADGTKVTDHEFIPPKNTVLKIGKHRFMKIIVK